VFPLKNQTAKNLAAFQLLRQPLPKPPKTLGRAGRALWNAMQESYRITDPAGLLLLETVCRSEDTAQQMREQVGTSFLIEGKPNPLLSAIRDVESTKRNALKQLNLDLEPLHDHPGRPPGGK
jgi:hypothetical protein